MQSLGILYSTEVLEDLSEQSPRSEILPFWVITERNPIDQFIVLIRTAELPALSNGSLTWEDTEED